MNPRICLYFTSRGAPEDMHIADGQRLFVNALQWTLTK
jgi:hypothetical protein